MSALNLQEAKDDAVLAKAMRDAAAKTVFDLFYDVRNSISKGVAAEKASTGLDEAIGQYALSNAICRYTKNERKKVKKQYKELRRKSVEEMNGREE